MIGTIIGPPEGKTRCGVGQRGDFTSHHDVAPVPDVRVAHALWQETGRPQHGHNVCTVVDTSAGTDIVGEKGGNGETCTQQNRYFIPVSPIHPLAKNLSGKSARSRIGEQGCAKIGPAGGSEIRIPAPSIPFTAKNLCTEASA